MTNPESFTAPKRGALNQFLNLVERLGNRLPDPLVLYIVLAAAVPFLSWLAVQANWSAIHPATGEELYPVSLLSAENLRRMFTEAVGNFVRFPPLGTVLVTITSKERKGLIAAGITALLVAIGVALLVIPQNGLLRDAVGGIDPFIHSLVILIMLFFLFPGVAYGWVAGTCRTSRQFSTMTGEAMGTMGGYIVLAFAAAQFVAYFSWSNLGLLVAIEGADTLKALGVGHLPLILSFMLLACGINLVIGSASAKWGIMAPVFVPMFMALGLSPEMTQATYRVGDSITNMITPLNPYFPIILSFALRYDRKMGIGTLVSGTLPYAIGFGIAWAILLTIWFLLNLPLGRGASILLGS